MGNHKLEHRQSHVNNTSPIMSKVAIVETRKQHVGVGVIQSLDVRITSTIVEMVVVPNIDIVKRGVPIVFTAKLGSELGGVSTTRNLS